MCNNFCRTVIPTIFTAQAILKNVNVCTMQCFNHMNLLLTEENWSELEEIPPALQSICSNYVIHLSGLWRNKKLDYNGEIFYYLFPILE